MDREQKKWYDQFMKGSFLVKGWKKRSVELQKGFSTVEKKEIEKLLETLGTKLGSEWSRPNNIRKVNTEHLKSWGDKLTTSKSIGFESLIEMIDEIDKKVETLIN